MTENPLGPPPVEPLGDVAWSRVERGLWARLDGAQPIATVRSRRWIWLAVPAIAAAAVVAVVFALPSRDTPGSSSVVAEDGPTRVVTGAAPSSLSIGDVHLAVDADSAVVMSRDGAAPIALLERGAAWFTVAPRGERPPFVVIAGDTIVRVIGTRFRVARFGEHATVEVERGRIDIQFRGIDTEVGAGQTWSSQTPSVVAAIVKTAASEPGPRTSIGVKSSADASSVGSSDVEPNEPPRNGKPNTGAPSDATPNKPAPLKPLVKRTTEVKPTEIKPTDTPAVDDCMVAARRCTKYDRLQGLEQHDPATALAGYLELSRTTGSPWAEVALYAAGRIAADRRDPRAEGLLRIYLRRFPTGKNVDDVRILLARIQGVSP